MYCLDLLPQARQPLISVFQSPRLFCAVVVQSNELVHNVSAGVIISNQSLVMQRVARAQAGHYACHARNVVGRGTSNTLTLDVKCESRLLCWK